MQNTDGRKERVIAITRQLLEQKDVDSSYECVDSGLVDLGPAPPSPPRQCSVGPAQEGLMVR